MKCTDCKDGKYIGLNILEDCKTCNGTGLITCGQYTTIPNKITEFTIDINYDGIRDLYKGS